VLRQIQILLIRITDMQEDATCKNYPKNFV